MLSPELKKSYWLLRVVYGAIPIVAGLDKFTNLLTNWEQYLSPWVTRIVPASTFMPLVGVVEIAAGVLVLSRFTRIGAYVVAAWLVGIALNLLTTGHFLDVAVRDLALASGAFTLAKLAEALGQQTSHRTVAASSRLAQHAT